MGTHKGAARLVRRVHVLLVPLAKVTAGLVKIDTIAHNIISQVMHSILETKPLSGSLPILP